jgi:hypothetical protein
MTVGRLRLSWVKCSRYDYVGIASAIPQTADDLLQRPSRPSRAMNGLMQCSKQLFDDLV